MDMDHGFYSYKLKKPFTSLSDLKAAEEELTAKEEKEKRKKEERASAAKEIEELIRQREDLNAKIDEKLTDFKKKFGDYHYTMRSLYDPETGTYSTYFRFL